VSRQDAAGGTGYAGPALPALRGIQQAVKRGDMADLGRDGILDGKLLPVDIVLHPSWWFRKEGITFDEDFFFHPARRVEVERKMERILYERWGQFGQGEAAPPKEPIIGAIHLAAGFLVSEMLGCRVDYVADSAPRVLSAHLEEPAIDAQNAFCSPAFKKLEHLVESLHTTYGYVRGDVNWGGILNVALDLRGESLFLDLFDRTDAVRLFFADIAEVIQRFTAGIQQKTGTSSVSVNRSVRHFTSPVFLHSECSHTMLSVKDYEKHLLRFDRDWSVRCRPFGIHYCGPDPHRYAESFARIPHLDFLDVGWGGDVKLLRQFLPRTFLNIRLSPVEIIHQSSDEIRDTIRRLVADSGNPWLTGICCINMDDQVQDDKITAIFETVADLRNEYERKATLK
jgi:hypothetical protein